MYVVYRILACSMPMCARQRALGPPTVFARRSRACMHQILLLHEYRHLYMRMPCCTSSSNHLRVCQRQQSVFPQRHVRRKAKADPLKSKPVAVYIRFPSDATLNTRRSNLLRLVSNSDTLRCNERITTRTTIIVRILIDCGRAFVVVKITARKKASLSDCDAQPS